MCSVYARHVRKHAQGISHIRNFLVACVQLHMAPKRRVLKKSNRALRNPGDSAGVLRLARGFFELNLIAPNTLVQQAEVACELLCQSVG